MRTITGLLAVMLAASSAAATPASAQQPVQGKSEGISATVTGAVLAGKGVMVQMMVGNDRQQPIFISPILNGSTGSGLISAKGTQYVADNDGHSATGMAACILDTEITVNINRCLREFPVTDMTRLDPGQATVLAIPFHRLGGDEKSASVSLVLKFVVRAPQAEGQKPAPLSDVVTVTLPMIPVSPGS